MIDILIQLANGFVHCLTPLNMAMRVTVIVMGLLIVSGELTTLNSKAQHALNSLGLDFLYNI